MALIQRAYLNFAEGHIHVWPPEMSIEGGPAWINSGSYQIEASAEGTQTWGALNGPMLQALLEDRFKLRVHREIREIPVYALTMARGGPKLRPFRKGSCAPLDLETQPAAPEPGQPDPLLCGMSEVTPTGYKLYGTTMADFATEFSSRLDRPVIDKTGLAGMFNIDLDLSPSELHPDNSAAVPDPFSVINAVRAAVRKVGLNLESTKGPGNFLVVDSVERPSEN